MKTRALRQAVTKNLSVKRLSSLAVDLGIFNARNLTADELAAKFHRTNVFDDNTMLHFVSINELRSVAHSMGLDPAGFKKSDLIAELLSLRSSLRNMPSSDEDSSSASAPESAPEQEQDQTQPESQPDVTSRFSPDGIPPNLYGTRHMLLYADREYWYLSSRKGGIIKVFSSKEDAQSWHRSFDEYRGFPHDPAVLRRPTGKAKSA
jgi:hypothetical protein